MSQCIECAPSSPLNDVAGGATEEDAVNALLMLQDQKKTSPEHMKKVLDDELVTIREIADPKLKFFSDRDDDWYEKVPFPGKYMQYGDMFIPLLNEEGEQELEFVKKHMIKFDELTKILARTLKGEEHYERYEQYLKIFPTDQLWPKDPKDIGELAKAYLRSIIWRRGLEKLKGNLKKAGIHIFKAEWCGYCRLLKKQAPHLFYRENDWFCISHEQSLSQYSHYLKKSGFDISGYPTIYFVKGDWKELYTDERNFGAIIDAFDAFIRKLR